jgi:hypothetical protein
MDADCRAMEVTWKRNTGQETQPDLGAELPRCQKVHPAPVLAASFRLGPHTEHPRNQSICEKGELDSSESLLLVSAPSRDQESMQHSWEKAHGLNIRHKCRDTPPLPVPS